MQTAPIGYNLNELIFVSLRQVDDLKRHLNLYKNYTSYGMLKQLDSKM